MPLSSAAVKHIALLARIEVSDAEVEKVLAELSDIFGLIEQMRAVDTDGIEPMSHAQDLVLRLREDAADDPDRRALFQSVAPAVEDGLYLVPRVIE